MTPQVTVRPRSRDVEISFEEIDASELEKTLERLPALSASGDADATGEIRADDILEAVDASPEDSLEIIEGSPEPAPLPSPPATVRAVAFPAPPVVGRFPAAGALTVATPRALGDSERHPTSIRPVAIEIPLPVYRPEPALEAAMAAAARRDADKTAPRRTAPHAGKPRKVTGFVVAGICAGIALAGAALVQRGVTADAVPPPIVVAAAPREAVAAPSPSPVPPAFEAPQAPAREALREAPHGGGARDVPVVDVSTLPRPVSGMVIGAAGHRLFIDGHVAPASSAVVPCGVHAVKVGSAGHTRALDVPCGGEVEAR